MNSNTQITITVQKETTVVSSHGGTALISQNGLLYYLKKDGTKEILVNMTQLGVPYDNKKD